MDDDLLNDLEELGGDEDLEELGDGEEDAMDIKSEDVSEVDPETLLLASKAESVAQVAKLTSSRQYRDVIKQIGEFSEKPRNWASNSGPVEDDPEYRLIVQANNLVIEIDNEAFVVHKFLKDHYAPKFPELESLVPNPIDYARTVKLIGNEMDLTRVDLKSLLPSATVMSLTVTATTSKGHPLSQAEIDQVIEACDMLLSLESGRRQILAYVESRMAIVAPNLSALVGSNIAAKLMGLSGGVTGLSKIPACNILVLGKVKKMNTGLSSVTQAKHQGLVYFTDLIATLPQEWKRKGARTLAAKVALAARVDQARTSPEGDVGRKFREAVQKHIDLLIAPPPGKSARALPIPDEGPKKRRAGKRYQRAKQQRAQTELAKAANRMTFGVAEDEVGFTTGSTKGLGLIGAQSGKIRATQADPRVKVGLARKHKLSWGGSSGATSGLSSSVAFTPVKGIELENPEAAAQRVKDVNDRYFSNATFKKPLKKDTPS
ncbi:hypothetical protein DFS34DRAFT_635584 [Phlyctochytrium arcticum]|nr:hypothetical protein DFS34DRAFT_635584 [Phlyctochytrium arcticum]